MFNSNMQTFLEEKLDFNYFCFKIIYAQNQLPIHIQ